MDMRTPIDMILDENCQENIVMYNEANEAVEMEQIAVVPVDGTVYVILRPLSDDTLAEDEALVFYITEYDNEDILEICVDDAMIDRVFNAYYQMLREAGIID